MFASGDAGNFPAGQSKETGDASSYAAGSNDKIVHLNKF